jgi:hypothetical protein
VVCFRLSGSDNAGVPIAATASDARSQVAAGSFATIGPQSGKHRKPGFWSRFVERKGSTMPPLIAWGVGILGGAALVRRVIREVTRINRELEEARFAHATKNMRTERIPTLRRDPVTGTYRPE